MIWFVPLPLLLKVVQCKVVLFCKIVLVWQSEAFINFSNICCWHVCHIVLEHMIYSGVITQFC